MLQYYCVINHYRSPEAAPPPDPSHNILLTVSPGHCHCCSVCECCSRSIMGCQCVCVCVYIIYKHTSCLVEAPLQILNVDFVDLLVTQIDSSLPLQVLWVISGELVHPGLFEFCFLAVAVIVNKLKFIQHPNRHKLWEV